jgi:hypothetical protein
MTGTIRGLPYPTGGDKVVDGDNAMQQLADAIDKRPLCIVNGTVTATTAGALFANLAAVVDTHAMVAPTRITIPAGFSGVWAINGRFSQNGVITMSVLMRQVGTSTIVATDARTGASGASASPVLSGLVILTAGQQYEFLMTCASTTVACTINQPLLSLHFIHA